MATFETSEKETDCHDNIASYKDWIVFIFDPLSM